MPTRLGDDRGLAAELTLMWAVVGLCAILFLLGLRATAPTLSPPSPKPPARRLPRARRTTAQAIGNTSPSAAAKTTTAATDVTA